MRKKFLILLILFLIFNLLLGQELKVTFVKKNEVKNPASKVKAIVTFKLNNVFVIEQAKIIEGRNGKFVAMPSEKYRGEWKDICFPIKKEFRDEIENAILNDKFSPIPTEKQKVEITEIRIYTAKNPQSKVKAFASITLNNLFVIKDIKIIEGKEGLFIGWPSIKTASGDFQKIIYPVKDEKKIEDMIIEKYKEESE